MIEDARVDGFCVTTWRREDHHKDTVRVVSDAVCAQPWLCSAMGWCGHGERRTDMSKRQRVKNYWLKRKESFKNGKEARCRARILRNHGGEHISHVQVDKEGDVYIVRYSAARWWLEELSNAGISF